MQYLYVSMIYTLKNINQTSIAFKFTIEVVFELLQFRTKIIFGADSFVIF